MHALPHQVRICSDAWLTVRFSFIRLLSAFMIIYYGYQFNFWSIFAWLAIWCRSNNSVKLLLKTHRQSNVKFVAFYRYSTHNRLIYTKHSDTNSQRIPLVWVYAAINSSHFIKVHVGEEHSLRWKQHSRAKLLVWNSQCQEKHDYFL